MDLGSIVTLISDILGGGPHAIIIILILFIIGLLYDRTRILKELHNKDEKISNIVDSYYKGNISLTEALNNLKNVLYEIRGKL